MLSIVPLMNGGGLFETGAGGSAPKHVQQFCEENYLRWDSLGEFFALTSNESQIVAELLAVQGQKADVGGYYKPDNSKADAALRPSATLNGILAGGEASSVGVAVLAGFELGDAPPPQGSEAALVLARLDNAAEEA